MAAMDNTVIEDARHLAKHPLRVAFLFDVMICVFLLVMLLLKLSDQGVNGWSALSLHEQIAVGFSLVVLSIVAAARGAWFRVAPRWLTRTDLRISARAKGFKFWLALNIQSALVQTFFVVVYVGLILKINDGVFTLPVGGMLSMLYNVGFSVLFSEIGRRRLMKAMAQQDRGGVDEPVQQG